MAGCFVMPEVFNIDTTLRQAIGKFNINGDNAYFLSSQNGNRSIGQAQTGIDWIFHNFF